MTAWIAENLGTILVAGVLAVIVALIIVKLRRDKKKGASCGCSCQGCSGASGCGKK